MRMKKITSVLLAAILCISMLAGCTKKEAADGTGDGGKKQEPKGTEVGSGDTSGDEALKPVTLHFIFFGEKKSATDEVWKAIADYTRDTLNCDYDIQFIAGSDYSDKLLVKAAAGDAWDMNFDSDWTCYYSMINKDAYLNLDELLPKYAPDLYKVYQEKGVLSAAKNKGHIVALPWTMTMNNRDFLQWRGDLAETAGLTVDKGSLKDWEGIDKFLYQLKAAYPDKYIIESANFLGTQEGYYDLGHGLVVNLNDPECKVVAKEDTESFITSSKYAEKWQADGLIWKDVLTDQLDHNALINQGKLITKWGTHEFANQKRAWAEESAYWDSTEIYPEGLYANRTPLSNAMCIPATSENPERTLMFMNMLETDQTLYDMVHYGILGTTYELDGQEAVFPQGMDGSNSNYMEWGGRWGIWKPQFMRPDASYSEGFWQREAEFAASMPQNVVSPLDGFSFDSSNVKTELAQRDQIYNDAWKLLTVGLSGGYEDAIAKLKSDSATAGLDKLVAEYQKQVDAFLASK